jgi:antirestriction protein ArdC
LAHELTHALLHENENDRQAAELEAESSACVICQTLGIASGDYSFGYVTLWVSRSIEAIAKIRASTDGLHKTASIVLDGIEFPTTEEDLNNVWDVASSLPNGADANHR